MKFTREQIKSWMQTAAWVNNLGFGVMKNGRYCLYRRTGKTPVRKDVVITEAQFVKDMERGWH